MSMVKPILQATVSYITSLLYDLRRQMRKRARKCRAGQTERIEEPERALEPRWIGDQTGPATEVQVQVTWKLPWRLRQRHLKHDFAILDSQQRIEFNCTPNRLVYRKFPELYTIDEL